MEMTINERNDLVESIDCTKSKPNTEPKAFYFCIYGGIAPICSDCSRNHINSVFRTEDISNWYNPDHNSNFKKCYGYINH